MVFVLFGAEVVLFILFATIRSTPRDVGGDMARKVSTSGAFLDETPLLDLVH